jgi:hypothetical protein
MFKSSLPIGHGLNDYLRQHLVQPVPSTIHDLITIMLLSNTEKHLRRTVSMGYARRQKYNYLIRYAITQLKPRE